MPCIKKTYLFFNRDFKIYLPDKPPNAVESKEKLLDFTEKLPSREAAVEQERNNRIINSAVAYMAAFTIVYVSFNVITSLFAKRHHLFYKLFFFKVEFTQNYDMYTNEAVLNTFTWPPFLCLLFGVSALIIQKLYRKRPGILKTFWLWLGIHFLNFFCTQLVLMPIKNTGSQGINASFLGVVADYMYWEDFAKIIASIIATMALIFIGAITAKPLIQITNSTQHVFKNENRIVYLFQTVLLPYLICSGVVLIYFSDGSFILNLGLVFTMFVIVVSIFINAMKNKMIMIYRLPETGMIENKFLIILASTLILMKIFLNNGIMF
jgi:hypothetical protein